jgi:site-specific DNA recombinase
MKIGSTKPVRCAIYTRVSTDQGLEQDFNSLDAQYEASQAYIPPIMRWNVTRPRANTARVTTNPNVRPMIIHALASR